MNTYIIELIPTTARGGQETIIRVTKECPLPGVHEFEKPHEFEFVARGHDLKETQRALAKDPMWPYDFADACLARYLKKEGPVGYFFRDLSFHQDVDIFPWFRPLEF